MAQPLYPLTGKRELPPPTPVTRAAYEEIRAAVRRLPQLYEQAEQEPVRVRLYTDASDIGMGAVLERKDGKPIGYYSHAFTAAERNYSIYEKELLALLSAAEHWQYRLIGQRAIYFVDNRALSLLNANTMQNPRVARWIMRLAKFGIDFRLLKSEQNIVADYLSRYSWDIVPDEYKVPYVLSGGG
jgi:hypothetical protein